MFMDRLITRSLRDERVLRILDAALSAVEPAELVRRFLLNHTLPPHSRCFLLGLGKAAGPMIQGAAELLPGFEAALVITKHAQAYADQRIRVLNAGHPIPDARSLAAGQAALDFVSGLKPQDLLVCLVSGGGSSLATVPVDGVSLEQIQALSSDALASGANIDEINNLRRCLDRIKGGGLALATRARVLGLVLSDVIGDRIESVASGPTTPSAPDIGEAERLLRRLRGGADAPLSRMLRAWSGRGSLDEAERVTNRIIGSAATAAQGAFEQAHSEGFAAKILRSPFVGEARAVGQTLGRRIASEAKQKHRPGCLIAVGESTVTLGNSAGRGGRNQELALAAAEFVDAMQDCIFVALATDGEDGPTDAAGAVVTGETIRRAQANGMRAADYLERHDSYRFFETLGDLLRPGHTGTNVNDIALLVTL